MKELSKICAVCKQSFSKPTNISRGTWEKRVVCSTACSSIHIWNVRGRQKKPACVSCGKPVAKASAKYCSIKCRTPRRFCAWCGKEAKIASEHKYCSPECSYRASETPTVVRICENCGKPFEYKPNPQTKGRFCSSSCGGQFNVEHGIVPDPTSEYQTAARVNGVHNSPIAGPFATHHTARDWFLVSPDQETFHIRNLKLFIRERADLFTEDELKRSKKGKLTRAYSGIVGIASSPDPKKPKKRRNTVWHGWRWWNEGESRWEKALLKEETHESVQAVWGRV